MPSGALLRVLGVGFGLAITIGNTIGAGIFRAPGDIAARLPDPWLYLSVWAIGGLYALLGAIQMAELGTTVPRSGGQYVFARHALGEYAGFIVGWSDWISTCGTTAAVAIVVGEFSGALIPAASGRGTAIAVSVAIVFAAAQWRGVRSGSAVQNVTSALKGVLFAAIIVVAFVSGGGIETPQAAIPEGLALATAFILALQSVIYTYDGWTGPVYFSEEVRDGARNIPRAVIGGVLLVVAVYLLVNVGLLLVVPVTSLAGRDFAAGVAAEAILGARGESVLRAITIVSMLSAINAYHLMASRVLFAMSRDGLVSARVARVNAGGTPDVALWLGTVVSVLFILFGGTFAQVITVLAFFFVANYALSFLSVFVMRLREPERPRPYRAWGYPWTTGLALAGSIAFLAGAVISDTRNSLYALALLAASYPVYRWVAGPKNRTRPT